MDGNATPFDQQQAIDTIRVLSIDAVQQANSGHPGAPMGAAPMTYALWTSFLKHAPTRPDWIDRDRFVLSAGHASMLLYSMLHLTGYDLPLEELKRFRQFGSKTPGHPEFGLTPGVDATTGPLGQGFANAVGMAIAERRLAAEFNQPGHEIIDHWTYMLCSDGDLQEGIAAEAASLAGHLRLGKLVALYDDNDVQLDGPTSMAWSEDVLGRFEAYGWHVQRVADGEDLAAIEAAIEAARADERPSIISVKTLIGAGSPNKAGTHKVHGSPLGAEEVAATKEALGFDPEASFAVDPAVLAHFREAAETGEELVASWQGRLDAYSAAFPEAGAELRRRIDGTLAEGWDADLPAYTTEDEDIATRKASNNALIGLAGGVPELIGGSADLSSSNLTDIPDGGEFSADEHGRNIRYGVREHAMGGIANGIAYHGGLKPFVATFLPFSDYMRGSVRLAALTGLPVIYVWTHDSIGVGEDGPTHQAVEHYAALRAIPNLTFVRAGDPNEASAGWALAVENGHGPTAMVFTRQKLPVLPGTAELARDGVRAGGYVLAEAVSADGAVSTPELILLATGSELHLAMGAREALTKQGRKVRVVSMPSWERFEAQPAAYRDEVLPPDVTARVSVESGVSLGWDRYVDQRHGAIVAIDRYGMSAPAPEIFEAFGFTVENVAEIARGVLAGDVRGIISPDADHAGATLEAAEGR
ncbi:MAG: transketolase [Candidatus Limnocylindrales bacterium]